jgi:uncharacterized protein (TIGR00288 family)
MLHTNAGVDARVAVLVDCDNIKPEALDFVLRMVAQFGRVVLRRGYGNHATLANKWQEVLVRLAFTPCLQCQYAAGKNTSDIALALDAMEALFDQRADIFCLVTSDSDFAYMCRKLRERGATVHIVDEAKTPDALRNASDQFFEWALPEPAIPVEDAKSASKPAPAPVSKPAPRKRPKAVLSAVTLLAADTLDGRVELGALGQYLKRTNPGFSLKAFGYAALSDMVCVYPDLVVSVENGSGYWVNLRPKADTASTALPAAN